MKIGDVVRLKSGGPEMTVVGEGDGFRMWLCAWFYVESGIGNEILRPMSMSGGGACRDTFPEAAPIGKDCTE